MILLTNNKNNHKYERSVFKANFQWDYCLVKRLGIVPVTLQLYTSQTNDNHYSCSQHSGIQA